MTEDLRNSESVKCAGRPPNSIGTKHNNSNNNTTDTNPDNSTGAQENTVAAKQPLLADHDESSPPLSTGE
jgi:hypothetical protein